MSAHGEVAEVRMLRRGAAPPKHGLDADWGDPATYLSFGGHREALGPASSTFQVRAGWPVIRASASRLDAWFELALALSGLALAGFMILHLGLLMTAMLGADVMDWLAAFFERYYMLQSAAPVLVLILVAHVALALRKAPAGAREQLALFEHMRTLRHFDTWMWAIQLVTGAAILFLVSIHLWVILTDLPIQTAKSGSRVFGTYLWFYLPLLLLVEAHASAGIYRIAVKWAAVPRLRAHVALAAWMVVFLALGFAVLAVLYAVGAQS